MAPPIEAFPESRLKDYHKGSRKKKRDPAEKCFRCKQGHHGRCTTGNCDMGACKVCTMRTWVVP